jgi:Arc/MetJ family transcription regulator
MRTNIDLDEDLMTQAAAILGTVTKKSTVEAALKEIIRRQAMRELSEMRGTMNIDMEDVRPGWEPSRDSHAASA